MFWLYKPEARRSARSIARAGTAIAVSARASVAPVPAGRLQLHQRREPPALADQLAGRPLLDDPAAL